MPLENSALLLQKASRAGYCVGAYNVVDALTIEAVICAAESCQSPVIIQTSQSTIRRHTIPVIVSAVCKLAEQSPVPVGLHLDHGTDQSLILAAIQGGYTSVMIDASRFPFDENVRLTHQIVQAAHSNGVSVEAEIGVVQGVEDDLVVEHSEDIYTTPEEAIRFQKETDVDFLAVAIGTAHGFYKVAPKLNIDTLRQIRSQVDFPLVVHGGTGLGNEVIQELVTAGACKMNFSTQLKKSYIDSLFNYISSHRYEYDPLRLLSYAQQELVQVISAIITLLGGVGKAN